MQVDNAITARAPSPSGDSFWLSATSPVRTRLAATEIAPFEWLEKKALRYGDIGPSMPPFAPLLDTLHDDVRWDCCSDLYESSRPTHSDSLNIFLCAGVLPLCSNPVAAKLHRLFASMVVRCHRRTDDRRQPPPRKSLPYAHRRELGQSRCRPTFTRRPFPIGNAHLC
jgi:hypothetical protein